ncbi:hypothetical protein QYM36_000567 [Artemia franciscana]|uniref:GPR158/179 extracellular domain-containing protein n=1 Tax=Artemia franciscana TaxID=6661 RepID=A0AA88ISU1_ARTSF|nr:hypothetical protein QYM36_000567 [Artemia franciscana]
MTTTKPQGPLSATDEMLNTINDITTGSRGSLCISSSYKIVPVRIRAELFDASRQKVDLMASFLQDVGHLNDPDLLNSLIRNLVTDRSIILARVIVFAAEENQQLHTVYEAFVEKSETTFPGPIVKKIIDRIKVEQGTLERTEAVLAKYGIPINIVDKGYGIASEGGALSSDSQVPWFVDNYFPAGWNSSKFMPNISNGTFLGWWTYPYFWCLKNQWQMSYTVPLYYAGAVLSHNTESLNGLLVADVNLSNLDIHQCDQPVSTSGRLTVTDAVPAFVGTHKCHLETTECVSKAHGGWVRGSYVCQCKRGFYYPKGGNSFNGTLAEMAYLDKARFESDIYDRIYRCQKCAIGCETCVDDQPCIVPHDWTLRILPASMQSSNHAKQREFVSNLGCLEKVDHVEERRDRLLVFMKDNDSASSLVPYLPTNSSVLRSGRRNI